jgi:cephalosporin hydroxylase
VADVADANRARYLDLLESVLTGALTRDPPADPWSGGGYLPAIRAQGRDWPATALTMIGTARMRQLRQACETVIQERIPGDLIETGVWRGGAAIYMRAILAAWGATDPRVWAADSFQGLPEAVLPQDAGDRHHTYEQLSVSRAEVEANFRRHGFDDIAVLEGWFRETLPVAPIERLAVLRLDGDMYGSTMDALTALYPRLSPGGYCIVDDYFLAPCRQAVWDYRAAHFIADPIEEIDGMGVWWRKSAT